jgi:Flp pilus assembly pilin Flp
MLHLVANCLRDESGSEIVEYALLLGLIVIGAIGLMGSLGLKVVAKWNSLIESM